MEYNKRTVGTCYEQEAGVYLESKGFRIIEYNYRCRIGEIDIIAMDQDCLVFCEVKYRRRLTVGSPLEAVDIRKQKVLSKCASHYLMMKGTADICCRFDVLGIIEGEVTHIEHAFDYIR